MSEIERESICHVLGMKAAARRMAQDLGKSYKEYDNYSLQIPKYFEELIEALENKEQNKSG